MMKAFSHTLKALLVGRMAVFPLEPPLSKMLLMSVDLGCSDKIITITAMLSIENVFFRPRDRQMEADSHKANFHQPEGDHLTFLTVYEAWKKENYSTTWCSKNYVQIRAMKKAQDVRAHLVSIMDKYKYGVVSCGKNYKRILKAIVSGFFNHVARKDPTEGYRTLSENQTVFVHPASTLFQKNAEWVLYQEVALTTKEYMRNVCVIDPRWLCEYAPNYYVRSDPTKLSKSKQRQRVEPLYNKYQDPGGWRISKQRTRKN